ncbi:hypothetical protein [Lignipirellula cremea]|uniref:hypothetical protein n=1 Tax=Lignipirellula cremea TaxID=2528010 RepID=UPI0011A0D4B3|nr:hypothetical protein [Lignipirellula cremea]
MANRKEVALQVSSLEIVDPESSQVGIRLSVQNNMPKFELLDANGLSRLSVAIEYDNNPRIVFQDESGAGILGLGCAQHFGVRFSISDSRNQHTYMVRVSEKNGIQSA